MSTVNKPNFALTLCRRWKSDCRLAFIPVGSNEESKIIAESRFQFIPPLPSGQTLASVSPKHFLAIQIIPRSMEELTHCLSILSTTTSFAERVVFNLLQIEAMKMEKNVMK